MRFTNTPRRTRSGLALVAAASLCATVMTAFATPSGADPTSSTQWTMFGQNLSNTASTSHFAVQPSNVARLAPKWTFTTGGDVSARAAVGNGVAYFPDWSGHLYAVRASNGHPVWAKDILTDYLADAFPASTTKVVSRTSPFLDTRSHTLFIGTQSGAYLLAIDTRTGALKWRTQLDPHPQAIDTLSPVVRDGVIYVGVSSSEEAAATDPNYPCCSFRGSVLALNAKTGATIWKTFTVPTGYTGGAVWGSTIVPDPSRGVVYATTGNNYSTPTDPAFTQCVAGGGQPEDCMSPDNHFDSVLALHMGDGSVAWSQRLASSDDWNVACLFSGVNCPPNSGPDFDFGSGVNMFTIKTAAGEKTIIGAGQKSGVYSAFDPDQNGKLLWATRVGPGSTLGGMEWGSATDGQRIYVAIGNADNIPYTLQPSGEQANAGSWAALDPETGRILWQTADPNNSLDLGPLAVANGVVYAPSMGGSPSNQNMFGLDARTGQIRWGFASGASVIAGASLSNNTVFWGSGYTNLGIPGFTGNNTFYAFSLGGR